MKIVHLLPLSSICEDSRTAVFKYRNENDTQWTVIDVTLSPLLLSRIKDPSKSVKHKLNAGVPYYDHQFVSEHKSKNYADSPFRLVQFMPDKGSDIPPHAHLECVDESGKTIVDAFTNKVMGYENLWRKSYDFARLEVRKNTKMLADMTANWVQPNVRYENTVGAWRIIKTK